LGISNSLKKTASLSRYMPSNSHKNASLAMTNLGYRTDLFFLRDEGVITETPRFTVVETPTNHGYYFGNFLMLNEAPNNDQLSSLEEDFETQLGHKEGVNHRTFAWSDAAHDSLSAFTKAGYDFIALSVLIATPKTLVAPSHFNSEITVRAFETDKDWKAWTALRIAEREPGHSEATYRAFAEKSTVNYRKMAAQNRGNFYGAFIGDKLVASAGLFFENRTGRFQQVLTKSAFRKQGICRHMMHALCTVGFETLDQLVIVAEQGYHALGIYEAIGFKHEQKQFSLCWWPRED
jgi:predicted GNAT family acetyltransferase